MTKRSKRFQPFGGNKKSGKHAAEIRERENKIHELQQQLAAERLMRESRETELRRFLTFPHMTMHELVHKISFGDAVRLGLDKHLERILLWTRSTAGLEAWDEQIKVAVRECLASGKGQEVSKEAAEDWQVRHG